MRAGNPAFLLRLVVRPATSVAFFVIIAFALLSRALDSSVLAKTVVTHPPTTATTAFRAATATAAISSAMSDAFVHRAIDLVVPGTKTSDGAGVKLTRSIGSRRLPELDPFLMLDFFGSDDPDAYIAGFPDHPHRGFETVTYMIAGNMQHRDHCGNEGNLVAGSIQWMTAGKGIIHSEIPKQDEGLMQGFQLWCDLPNAMRMCDPRYQDIPPEDVPVVETDDGSVTVKVLAGSYGETTGPVKDVVTEPSYLDVTLAAGAEFEAEITKGHTCFAYVFQGSVDTGGRTIAEQNLVVFDRDSEADTVGLNGGESGGRFILVSGMPLNQTKVHYGPFVMETMEEIQQAFDDYRNGILGEYPSDE